jgi:hypothetical protein
MKLFIYRKPIASALDTVLNLMSLKTWSKAKEDSQFDKLFHLGCFCIVNNGAGTFKSILVEKNATIEISSTTFNISSYGENIPVYINNNITLNEFLKNGENLLGKDYFLYDPFNGNNGEHNGTNCQGYVRGLLEANGLYSPKINEFVFQPVDKILERFKKENVSYVPKVARVITDLGAVANNLIGKGLDENTFKMHAIKFKIDKMSFDEMLKHVENIAGRKNMKVKELKNYYTFRVIPRTKFIPSSYRSKKILNGDGHIVFGQLKK